MNFECVDKTKCGTVELCFTDSDGDEAVKILVTQKTAWQIVKEIQKKYSYAAQGRQND